MIRTKKICVKQHDLSDCGAACLASVSAFYGYSTPLSKIRHNAGTDKKGTNLTGMIDAAEKLGFRTKAVRVINETLSEVPLPAIAHITIKETWHHFVVIYAVGKSHVTVMDPATGKKEKWANEKFFQYWKGILLLIEPSENFIKADEKTSIWKRFYQLIKPHRTILFQAFIGAIFYSILGLASSIYVQKLIDFVIPTANYKLLNIMSLFLLILLIFRILIGYIKSIFMLFTGQKIDAMLIMGYYKHLLKLPQRFFETMRTGEIISRVNDAVKIRVLINSTAVDLLVNLQIMIFTFILMFLYSWEMALKMSLIIPLYIALFAIYNKLNKKYLRQTMEQTAELESHLVESINSMGTIKRFSSGEKENSNFELRLVPLLKSAFSANQVSIITIGINDLLAGLFLLILLWTGTYTVLGQKMTPGELMSFYALFGYMLGPLNNLIQSNRLIQDAMIAADRLFQILDLEQETENENMIDLKENEIDRIEFEKVSFKYGSGKYIFTKLDLQIEMHKITGITGDSGSGKSTLFSLIQKVYPLSEGRIFLGDYELDLINKTSLNKMIAVVPQKIDIFNGTVIENIAIGAFKPDMSKIIKVCNEIKIMDMIENLPHGLLTLLGENGVKLSGGELQKIAIARCVYHDPEIFLFDEPTASMDETSEEKIKSLIVNLKKRNKTVILISHRNSTLEVCDSIKIIKDGKLTSYNSENSKEKQISVGYV